MPSAGTDREIADGLQTIWTRSRGDIREHVASIERAADSIADGKLAEVERDGAERAAHKLAGTLGMFGLHRGTELARQAEAILSGTASRRDLGSLLSCAEELASTVETGPRRSAGSTEIGSALMLVSADAGLAEQFSAEAAVRGLRAVLAGDAHEARLEILEEVPAAVVVDLKRVEDAEEGLRLIAEIDERSTPLPVLVSGASEDVLDRVQLAGLGTRASYPAATDPGQLIEAVVRELRVGTGRDRAQVLAVDDDPTVLALLERLLEPMDVALETLSDPLQFWERLDASAPDLVIFDVDMPGADGIELCRAMRNDPKVADVPVMFLTGKADAGTVHRMFAAGADDYLSKPIEAVELTTRIGNRLDRARLARRLADTDGLTGLATRRKAEDVLARFLRLADRQDQPLSLAILDIDHFKRVNDTLGHAAGDEVLRRLSRLLLSTFRDEDLAARWGGEEFVVGMYGIDGGDALRRISDLLETFRESGVSFSAGVASFPDDGRDLDALHRAADAALYAAKAAGRDRVLGAGD